jgi:hypothetical protein
VKSYRAGAGIVGCLVAGVLLCLVGLDVASWSRSMRTGDVTYRATPESVLWSPDTVLPARLTRSLLGLGDDLAYRHALQAFRLAHIGSPVVSDPSLIVRRNDASVLLTRVVQSSTDSRRRSTAANLLGAIDYSDAVADYADRARLILDAVGRFQQAIAFDPTNDDAKYNLELTLALGRAQGLNESGGGTNPAPGGKGSKGAGAGTAGTGY